jgi:D-arabinose 1-dehydrogenase
MGLLTPSPPPWHPAPAKLLATASEAGKGWAGDLPNLALGYAIRNTGKGIPLVAGFSNIREVHECVKVWREVQNGINEEERMKCEAEAQETFQQAGFLDWSWASP